MTICWREIIQVVKLAHSRPGRVVRVDVFCVCREHTQQKDVSWVLCAHLDTFDTFYMEMLTCFKCLFVVAAKRFISF